jgi:hypothetical protein
MLFDDLEIAAEKPVLRIDDEEVMTRVIKRHEADSMLE